MGSGADAGGTRDRRSSLATGLEAVVGALFIDQGYGPARDFVTGFILSEMGSGAADEIVPQSAKSALQEAAQAQGQDAPSYHTVQSGADHAPFFATEVSVHGRVLGQGTGARKADAEREAAERALEAWDAKDGSA